MDCGHLPEDDDEEMLADFFEALSFSSGTVGPLSQEISEGSIRLDALENVPNAGGIRDMHKYFLELSGFDTTMMKH